MNSITDTAATSTAALALAVLDEQDLAFQLLEDTAHNLEDLVVCLLRISSVAIQGLATEAHITPQEAANRLQLAAAQITATSQP
jgi:ribonuclease PH